MSNNNILINFSSFLLIGLPIFLITGPLLSDLAVSLISLIFIFQIFINKDYKIFKNRWFQFLLIFWIYLFINSLFNDFNFDSLRISFSYFRFIFFIFAVSFLLSIKENNLKYFFYCLLFCYIILILDALIQFFLGQNLLGFKMTPGPRVSSFFGDDLILGSYLARLFPLLLGIYIFIDKKENSKFLDIIFILILILSSVVIFLSGERTALFYFFLSNIFLIIFLINYKKTRIITFCFSVMVIILSVFFNPSLKERMIDLTLTELKLYDNIEKKINKLDDIVFFTEQHTHHYKSAIKIYKDNYFFGVGIKNFRHVCHKPKYKISEISCSTHPHNTYIQLLSELGIIGFLFISFLFFYFISFGYKILRSKKMLNNKFFDFQLCLIVSILISLWPFSPSGNFFNNWLSIIYYLPVGFILYTLRLKKS